jgi:hypothetical protein
MASSKNGSMALTVHAPRNLVGAPSGKVRLHTVLTPYGLRLPDKWLQRRKHDLAGEIGKRACRMPGNPRHPIRGEVAPARRVAAVIAARGIRRTISAVASGEMGS